MIAPASRKVGKYEIVRKLGRGGMADVYLATDTKLGHTLALKLIEHANDQDTCDAIEAERRGSVLQAHLAAVDHHVAQIYDSGDESGFFFVAMEYVDGQDLSELMKRGPLMQEFAVEVAVSVAQTLENAHDLQVELGGKEFHGIVHGDIKPKNIRVDSHGRVRVLDFGIAKALSLSRRLTHNDFGSVGYGSPERLESGEVNEQSDLWSLAVMLYEMVTGLQPYQAASTELLDRMIRSRIPPPPAPDPCPKPLRRILVKAMAPKAADRYPSAREFREDLQAFLAGQPVQAILEGFDVTRRSAAPAKVEPVTEPAAPPVAEPPEPPTVETKVRPIVMPAAVVSPTVVGDDTCKTTLDDETRRTAPDDRTRRTDRVVDDPGGDTRKAKVVLGDQKARTSQQVLAWATGSLWRRRALTALAVLVVVSLIWALASAIGLYLRGAQLEQEIAKEQLIDPNAIWQEWSEVSDGNPTSWLLRGARKAVEQRLVAAADRVIDAFRSDSFMPESSWKNAQLDLQRVLSLDPDNTVRGKLRLTEGYLAWLASRHERKGPVLLADLNQSEAKFTEAALLMPKSPDPELGLAQVYVYGFSDIDKADRALQEAEHRGYHIGNRENAFLADGYRDRGERLRDSAHNMRGLPQEKDLLERAREDYGRAIQLYQAIIPYAKASDNILKVQARLDEVSERIQELDFQLEPGLPHAAKGQQPNNGRSKVPGWLSAILRGIWASRQQKQQ
ncbi:MAG TPA: serine/threonine-protein kinase [Bryobacteraceae bacterium]|nr:serine/threonine-protein kinase [Bryobacteraceae bacterium]